MVKIKQNKLTFEKIQIILDTPQDAETFMRMIDLFEEKGDIPDDVWNMICYLSDCFSDGTIEIPRQDKWNERCNSRAVCKNVK